MSNFDVVVIGGGAAGLSAALVLSRAQRQVVVIDAGSPRNAPASHMHGYLSRDGMSPHELLAAGREEVARYGGQLREGSVAALASRPEGGFAVSLVDGAQLTARRVVIATGLRDELPDVPDVRERFGRDVLHCPYCHGYEVRDEAVGVLGGSPNSIHQAQLVRQWADDVVFFANGADLAAAERDAFLARGIHVVDGRVTGVVIDNDRLTGVEISGGIAVARTALFVAPRFVANDALLRELGCVFRDDGAPALDPTGQTSVPGVWVAGNVANPRAQVITAAGEGSAAAIALNGDLVLDDVARALHDVRLRS